MKVRDGMTRLVLTIGPAHTLREAARLMSARRVGAAVVIDSEHSGIGILTERDVLDSIGAGQDPDTEFDYVNPRPVNREADALELKAKAQAALWLQQAGYDPGDICTVVGLPLMGTVPVGPDTAGTSGADDTGPDAEGTSGDESDVVAEATAILRSVLLNRARRGALL